MTRNRREAPAWIAGIVRFAALLLATASLSAPPAAAAEPERWYQVELIVFLRLGADQDLPASGERFRLVPEPDLPWGARALLPAPTTAAAVDPDAARMLEWFDTNVEPADLVETRRRARLLEAAMAAVESGELIGAPAPTPPPRSPLVLLTAAQRNALAAPAPAPDLEPTLDRVVGASDIEREPPVIDDAWIGLADDDAALTPHWRRLRGSAGYRPLLRAAWRQPMPRDERQTLWLSGEHVAGRLTVWRQRFLHVEGALWLDAAGWPSLLEALQASAAGASGQVPDRLADDVSAVTVTDHGPLPTALPWEFRRRMRSEELHYLDHPVLGALVRIAPWFGAPPDAADDRGGN